MPAVFGVHFREDRLPSFGRWQDAILEAGFDVMLTPVSLLRHQGMLPVKFRSQQYNSGFEFLVERWERGEESLADKPLFAHFRCNSQEWPAAICAAAGFAKATDGVFNDPYGNLIIDVDEIIAYADRESRADA